MVAGKALPPYNTRSFEKARLHDFPRSLSRLLILANVIDLKTQKKAFMYRQSSMSGPGAGFEYSSQVVSWLKRYVFNALSKCGKSS